MLIWSLHERDAPARVYTVPSRNTATARERDILLAMLERLILPIGCFGRPAVPKRHVLECDSFGRSERVHRVRTRSVLRDE